VRHCGHLPLALRIAGARLATRRQWQLASLADRLADEHGRLDELAIGDLQGRASFELTYKTLQPALQRAFRLLGLVPSAEFDAWVLAALLDATVPVAARIMEQLVEAQLVESARRDPDRQPRYHLHDLLRIYARERLEAD